jgi:hypothetical protein
VSRTLSYRLSVDSPRVSDAVPQPGYAPTIWPASRWALPSGNHGKQEARFSRSATFADGQGPGDYYQRMAICTLRCANIPGVDSRCGCRGRFSSRSAPEGDGANFVQPVVNRPRRSVRDFHTHESRSLSTHQICVLQASLLRFAPFVDLLAFL